MHSVTYKLIFVKNVKVLSFNEIHPASPHLNELSRVVGKLTFCMCENKAADQLHSSYCAADQQLCFRYIDSTIPLLPKSEISSLLTSSVIAQPSLFMTWSQVRNSYDQFSHVAYNSGVTRKEKASLKWT